jgi:hypothetical protein
MFDTAAKPVQGALFAEPDKFGTPDMFADIEEAAALTECPRCHSRELPAYFERHMNRHAATDRNHDENVRASAGMRRQIDRAAAAR